jgi:anaerobic ribonucleoside-triphosphate reductase activating protein
VENGWILTSLIAYPLYVLGVGKRVGFWTQGCSIHCDGCMSKYSWAFDKSKKKYIKDILKEILIFNCKKITISGGEPFDQKYLLDFLKLLKQNNFDDILVYSGYSEEYIFKNFQKELKYIDVLISEPFKKGVETSLLYKGSNNQKLLILNNDLKEIYQKYSIIRKDKKLQKFGNYIVGIPYQNDIKGLL